jgi:hypothetical protein
MLCLRKEQYEGEAVTGTINEHTVAEKAWRLPSTLGGRSQWRVSGSGAGTGPPQRAVKEAPRSP